MARGLYAFLGGALGRAREMGAAHGEAYKGMLTQLMEEEKLRREEERLQLAREAGDRADAAAGREELRLQLAIDKAGEPAKAKEPTFRSGPNGELLMWDGAQFIPAPGAPTKAPGESRGEKLALDMENARLLGEQRRAAVGDIPVERRGSIMAQIQKWEQIARERHPDPYSIQGDLLATLDPQERQLYDQLKAELVSGRAQSTMQGGEKSFEELWK